MAPEVDYVRCTMAVGHRDNYPVDTQMARYIIDNSCCLFRTTPRLPGESQYVFCTNEETTWSRHGDSAFDSSMLSAWTRFQSLTNDALAVFRDRYPAVQDPSLPMRLMPRAQRLVPGFQRDLLQLQRFQQAANHLCDMTHGNRFVLACKLRTVDNDILEHLKPKCETGFWYFKDEKYDPRTGRTTRYRPDDYVLATATVGYECMIMEPHVVSPINQNARRILEQMEKDLCHDDLELIRTLRNIACQAMDDTAVKQLYLFHGGSDSGKTVFTLLLLRITGERQSDDQVGRGYSSAADYWCRKQNPDFDETLADSIGSTLWVSEEPPREGRFELNNIKYFTGGQRCKAARKWGHNTMFTPTSTIIIGLNDVPHIDPLEQGIAERLFVVPFDTKFTDTAPEQVEERATERRKNARLRTQLRNPDALATADLPSTAALRDEYVRMLAEHYREHYHEIAGGDLPKCTAVEEATQRILDIGNQQRMRLEPVKHFLQHPDCPFEIVPNDATAVAVYEQFAQHWTDEWQVEFGDIPDARRFKNEITTIDGITYLDGPRNRRSGGGWTGQKNPYIGVRLKNQPAAA